MFAPKAPGLIKGAYNNTIIRLKKKTDTQQPTKLHKKNLSIVTSCSKPSAVRRWCSPGLNAKIKKENSQTCIKQVKQE